MSGWAKAREFHSPSRQVRAGAERVACTRARRQGIECELEGVKDAGV